MSSPRPRIVPKELIRYLFPVVLTIFLVLESSLGNASQLQSTEEPHEPTQPHDQGSVSCGKLVFLEDLHTAAKLIGLRDCSGSQVYIFGQRPAELFNYYEFYGVKVARGDEINDAQYGRLNQYIVGFTTYRMIPDCSYCGRNFEPPTPTSPPVIPTETVAALPPVVTEEVSAPVVVEATPADPQGTVVSSQCISDTAQVVAQAMGFPKYEFLIDQAPEMLEEAPGEEVCGTDATCLQTVQLKTLMTGMVEASFEASPGPRPIGQVMGAIATIMDSSAIDASCSQQGVLAVEMAKQFSIKGMAINSYAMHSPADFRVRDFENKDSGFFKSGEVKQDIPLSVTRREGESEYVFVPASSVAAVEFEGNSEGAMTFEAVRNAGNVVQEIAYDQVPVDAQTKGNLNTSAGAQPKLDITASSSGQLASLDPTRFEEFAIVASVAPVTATPTLSPTPVATATPEGFQLPGDSQLWVGLILIACVGAFLALLVIGGIYMLFVRGRTK